MATNYQNILESSIPGFSGLTTSASSLIKNLLDGNPSSGPVQQKSAQFGVQSGMPGSGVANAFGYDLYGKKAEERKQRGYDDLLKMITGYSLPVANAVTDDSRFAWQQDEANRARSERNWQQQQNSNQRQPKKYGLEMIRSGGAGVPGGFSDRTFYR